MQVGKESESSETDGTVMCLFPQLQLLMEEMGKSTNTTKMPTQEKGE